MYQLKVSVENNKYCGTFKITGAHEAAEKICNNVGFGTQHNIKSQLENMEVGEVGGFNDRFNSSEIVWVTKLK